MVEEMVRRDRENISEPRVVIFIDELADLMEQGGKAMDRLMTRLTQRGRSAGLHVIACTQKPLAASIGSLTRSNFPVRLVGSVARSTTADSPFVPRRALRNRSCPAVGSYSRRAVRLAVVLPQVAVDFGVGRNEPAVLCQQPL